MCHCLCSTWLCAYSPLISKFSIQKNYKRFLWVLCRSKHINAQHKDPLGLKTSILDVSMQIITCHINNGTSKDKTLSKWTKIKNGVLQGSILGPLIFLLYVNNLLMIINNKSIPILFADDTSILFTHSNFTYYNNNISTVFDILNK
jgi:Reverse transcriptase (RNA-dependent DNA polymerase).